jgi:GNAT superfamily N-acetyltransferase
VPVACGGYRSLGPEVSEIKRMFVTASARRQGHARRVLAELERRVAAHGARRIRLLSTDVLREARALYVSAGYEEAEVVDVGGRRDVWLEKPL